MKPGTFTRINVQLFNLYEVKESDGKSILQYLKPYGLQIPCIAQTYVLILQYLKPYGFTDPVHSTNI
jgi:hypothetical protein